MAEYQQETLQKNRKPQKDAAGSAQSTENEVRRESYGPEGGMLSDSISTRIQNQRGSGSSLTPTDNKKFTARFGRDMSDVRIHSGSESESLNETLNSRAFTVGSDIFLGKGVNPASSGRDRQTLTHELTHVAQTDGRAGSGKLRLGADNTAAEHEARSAAHSSRTSVSPASSGTVRREGKGFWSNLFGGFKSKVQNLLFGEAGKAYTAAKEKVQDAINKLSDDDKSKYEELTKKIREKETELSKNKQGADLEKSIKDLKSEKKEYTTGNDQNQKRARGVQVAGQLSKIKDYDSNQLSDDFKKDINNTRIQKKGPHFGADPFSDTAVDHEIAGKQKIAAQITATSTDITNNLYPTFRDHKAALPAFLASGGNTEDQKTAKKNELTDNKNALMDAARKLTALYDQQEQAVQPKNELQEKQNLLTKKPEETQEEWDKRIADHYDSKIAEKQQEKDKVIPRLQAELDDLKDERVVLLRKSDNTLTFDEIAQFHENRRSTFGRLLAGVIGIKVDKEDDHSDEEISKRKAERGEKLRSLAAEKEPGPQTDWGKASKDVSPDRKAMFALRFIGIDDEGLTGFAKLAVNAPHNQAGETDVKGRLTAMEQSEQQKKTAQRDAEESQTLAETAYLDIKGSSTEALRTRQAALKKRLGVYQAQGERAQAAEAQRKKVADKEAHTVDVKAKDMSEDTITTVIEKLEKETTSRTVKTGKMDVSEASESELSESIDTLISQEHATADQKRKLMEIKQKLLAKSMKSDDPSKSVTVEYQKVTDALIEKLQKEIEAASSDTQRKSQLEAEKSRLEQEKGLLIPEG